MTEALVVIDIQNSFVEHPSWPTNDVPDLAEKVKRLVDHFRETGRAVIWVLHEAPGSNGPFDPRRGLCELQAPLAVLEGEPVVRKTSHDAFTTTRLAQHLHRERINDLVICGIRTEQCCESTARLASDMGFGVRFVLDATSTTPRAAYDGSTELSPAEIKRATATALYERFATISALHSELGA